MLDRRGAGWKPVQLFAAVFGAVYVAVGVAGFQVTGFSGWTSHMDGMDKLIVFGVNPLHNAIHLAIGLVWLAGCASLIWSRRVSLAVGVAFALITVAGVANLLGFLGMSGGLADPDNLLHLVTASLAFYFAIVGSVRREPGPAASEATAW
ncbi:MAG TPA: DUF4383 domain-containing protein [Frankiaceae bacterium]|nr:DUF4383 domain-containing protein [Frankiaceae bacterium]